MASLALKMAAGMLAASPVPVPPSGLAAKLRGTSRAIKTKVRCMGGFGSVAADLAPEYSPGPQVTSINAPSRRYMTNREYIADSLPARRVSL